LKEIKPTALRYTYGRKAGISGLLMIILIFGLCMPFQVRGQFQHRIIKDRRLIEIERNLVFNIDSAYIIAGRMIEDPDTKSPDVYKYLNTTLALIYQLKGDGNEAVVLLEKAKSVDIKDDYLKAYTLYVDALISMEIGAETQALEAILEAIDLFEELRQEERCASCYTVLSKLYFSLGKTRDALETIGKSITIHKLNKNNPRLAGDYHNLAVLISVNNTDSSLSLLNTAIRMNKKYKNNVWLANNYRLKGDLFRSKEAFDSAQICMLDAEQIYKKLKRYSFYLDTRLARGNLFFLETKPDSALTLYNSAIQESKAFGVQLSLTDVYRNLSEIYFQKRNYIKAREFAIKYDKVKDSIQTIKNNNLLSIIEIRNKFKQQKEELKIENEQIKLASRKKNWLIVTLVFLVLITGFLIYTTYKWKVFNEKKDQINRELMSKEIELRNRELALAVMGQVKQTKSMELLREKLKDIEHSVSQKNKPPINQLINELSHDKSSLIWKEFEMRFSSINNDFYDKLKNYAPDLTLAEIKTCTFLMMGLNTKEIAALLYKSPLSVEVERSRIRKKLGLTNSKMNLNEFLRELS